jgi:hypothetical protein
MNLSYGRISAVRWTVIGFGDTTDWVWWIDPYRVCYCDAEWNDECADNGN